jgi:hypothetical protein
MPGKFWDFFWKRIGYSLADAVKNKQEFIESKRERTSDKNQKK